MTEFAIKSLQEAKQACFTGAVRGLRYQGWEMCHRDDNCMWNLGQPGKHCAIGWLIPWPNQKEHDQDAQTASNAVTGGLLAPVVQKWHDAAPRVEVEAFRKFLNSMQVQHDGAEDMCTEFKQLGDRNNLKWPEEETQDGSHNA